MISFHAAWGFLCSMYHTRVCFHVVSSKITKFSCSLLKIYISFHVALTFFAKIYIGFHVASIFFSNYAYIKTFSCSLEFFQTFKCYMKTFSCRHKHKATWKRFGVAFIHLIVTTSKRFHVALNFSTFQGYMKTFWCRHHLKTQGYMKTFWCRHHHWKTQGYMKTFWCRHHAVQAAWKGFYM